MLMQIFNRIEYMMEGIELEANDLKMYGNLHLPFLQLLSGI